MTDYNLIFGSVLLFNAIVTFRASSYWKKYFPDAASNSGGGGNDDQEHEDEQGSVALLEHEVDPSSSSNDDDVEHGGDIELSKTATTDAKTTASTSSNTKPPPLKSAASDAAANIRHTLLLRKYLVVYLLAAMSDWLQGPYVYALYDAYGYSQHDIAVLFVAGFGSSMVFGSFVGGMADVGGRRRFVVIFAIVYALSCMTKRESYSYYSHPDGFALDYSSPHASHGNFLIHSMDDQDFKNFSILMIGRLLGGVATSLLFSVFEAWLIGAHSSAGVMVRKRDEEIMILGLNQVVSRQLFFCVHDTRIFLQSHTWANPFPTLNMATP